MRHLPVHWTEGMFLRPHHFQASDRHACERMRLRTEANDPCSYGIVNFEIDPTALANRQIEVKSCRAVLPDGTLIWLEQGEEPDRVSIAVGDALTADDSIRVYLAVPRFDPVGANVSSPDAASLRRYVAVRQDVQDDTAGGNDQELEFRKLNVRLLLSNQDCSGYETLPVAQIRRAGSREAAPEIDPDYYPPMLAIDAWVPGRDIVRGVYDLLGRRAELLSEQAVSRQVGFSSSEPGDLDRLIMLSKVLEAHAVLRVVAFAPGVHPRTAYLELCRIAGQLAVFEPDRRMGDDLLPYDHDDLGTIFRDVRKRIENMLSRVSTLEYVQRYFEGSGPARLDVMLDARWLEPDWRWYIGVMRGDVSEEECDALLNVDGRHEACLDLKLGSSRQVDRLFTMGIPGLELKRMERAPQSLPAKARWLYYQVGKEGAAWRDVREALSLAIRLNEKNIGNVDNLMGNRTVDVVHSSQAVSFQFALFAVPPSA